jgi:ABC-type xylose transport system permease subunit
MSQKRIHHRSRGLPSLPYWKSILASAVLVLAMMLLFEALADPRSGDLRRPGVVVPVFVLFVVIEAGMFYAESRLRTRRPTAPICARRRIFM